MVLLCAYSKQVGDHEKNISAQQSEKSPDSRFSCPHAYPQRSRHHQRTPREGPKAPVRLIDAVASARFPREFRLTRKAQFDRVFARASRSRENAFTILARHNDLDHGRLGLAISRKAARRAVWRHRIKRVVRESFRLSDIHRQPLDLVVMARPAATAMSNDDLRLELGRHWRRLAQSTRS